MNFYIGDKVLNKLKMMAIKSRQEIYLDEYISRNLKSHQSLKQWPIASSQTLAQVHTN